MEYMVFCPSAGKWLADDEQSWTPHHDGAAIFTDEQLARDVGQRNNPPFPFLILANLGK